MKPQELSTTSAHTHQILVFRSDLNDHHKATYVCDRLLQTEGILDAHVDLWDWEHVLRIDCMSGVEAANVERFVSELGYSCAELED